jgi:hypothetical protein
MYNILSYFINLSYFANTAAKYGCAGFFSLHKLGLFLKEKVVLEMIGSKFLYKARGCGH